MLGKAIQAFKIYTVTDYCTVNHLISILNRPEPPTRTAHHHCAWWSQQPSQRQCSSSFCCFSSWTQEKLEEQVNWHVTGSDCFLRMAAHIFSTSKSKPNPTHVESSCVNGIDMNLIQT